MRDVPANSVVGMTAIRGVRVGSDSSSVFLQAGIRERFTVVVLREPHVGRLAVLEAHHRVLPVADVVADQLTQHGRAVVEGVEVHVEGIDLAIPLVVDDDGCRFGAAGAGVGLHAFEIGGVGGWVDVGGEIEVAAVEGAKGGVQVVKCKRRLRGGDGDVVDLWLGVGDLCANVGGEVGFRRVEPY